MKPLIAFTNVNYSYVLPNGEKIHALCDVSMRIERGEYIALIGANGSGKTTIAKLMNGLFIPDSGEVRVDDISTHSQQNTSEIVRRVGLIFQNPREQIISSIVEEDVAFGPENLCLPTADIRGRVEGCLRQSGAHHLLGRQTFLLSAGETQRVALAGVLAMQPECIIFDETTAMLDPISRKELLELMRTLNDQGYTILHITHDLDEALQAGRILVLNKGQLVMDGSPQQVFSEYEELYEMDLGIPFLLRYAAALHSYFPQISAFYQTLDRFIQDIAELQPVFDESWWRSADTSSERIPGEPHIQLDSISHTYMAGTPLAQATLKDISFNWQAGAAVGLVGHTGSGKSTLLQHLNGLIRPQTGSARVAGFDLSDPQMDVRQLRREVGLVFQNPEAQFFETYVGDEIAFAARTLGYAGKLREVVQRAMYSVGLDFEEFVDRPLRSLSGGQKRRVALASYLVVQPDILLLDEPFAGLDPRTHAEMAQFMVELQQEGKTVILSTHNMRDLVQITPHAMVLQKGEKVFEGATTQLFSRTDLESWDLMAPLETRIMAAMRQQGWKIPIGVQQWSSFNVGLQNAMKGGENVLL